MTTDDAVRAALAEGPLWSPDLVTALASVGWRRLVRSGIYKSNYGTRAVLAQRDYWPGSPGHKLAPLSVRHGPVRVESFAARMPARYRELGIVEAEIDPERLATCWSEASTLLRLVPRAAAAVSILVRSFHALKVVGPDFDTSYSDPEVPFSIFVGVHPLPVPNDAIRTAEGVLHETMHLQLSLAEWIVPLVTGDQDQRHSPWQDRPRPTQGLVHGLFVFRAIQTFLEEAVATGALSACQARHAEQRIKEIDDEVMQLEGLDDGLDLTEEGRIAVASLLHPSRRGGLSPRLDKSS